MGLLHGFAARTRDFQGTDSRTALGCCACRGCRDGRRCDLGDAFHRDARVQRGHAGACDIVSAAASAVLAVVACSIGLAMAGIGVFTWGKLVGAGTLMGLGVAGMHYLGMSAMLMSATMTYDLNIVAISVGMAIVASIVALWLAFHLRGKLQMLGSVLVMGAAVCGMHYTGMAAVDFTDNGILPAGFEQGLRSDYLGVLIFVVVVVLLGVALGLSLARQQRRVELTI